MQRLSGFPFQPWFLDAIRGARCVVLMTHRNPDADGLGSEIALMSAARSVGIDVRIVNEDPLPLRYSFLDPQGDIQSYDQGRGGLDGVELGLLLDTHEVSRAGRPARQLHAAGVPLMVLDHHRVSPDAEVVGSVLTDFSSTGEMIYRLIEALGWPLSVDAARGIYAAMSFDTGSFRFLRNRPETMFVAGALLQTGLDTNPIQEALWASRPLDETRLMGRIAAAIELTAGGKVASVVVSPEMLQGLKVDGDAMGEAIPLVIGVQGVLAAAMFKPARAPGRWKVSLRSKAAVQIGEIAVARGGGGHANAAGMTLEGDLDVIVAEILGELKAVVEA